MRFHCRPEAKASYLPRLIDARKKARLLDGLFFGPDFAGVQGTTFLTGKGGRVMRANLGFTLLEVLIVVAIIAILSAIALPAYQGYVAKVQLAGALAEIRAGITTVEYAQQENKDVSLVNAKYVGLNVSSRCSAVDARLESSGAATLSCTLIGNKQVAGLKLYLRRNPEGVWLCDTSEFDRSLRPGQCG
ncbi:pilin [Xanthomonas campestris pv. campestris]|nr:pilin [Xanthomonas campestris pv. campestris]